MTVVLTALIIAEHMVGNNKYGERQPNIILHLSVRVLSSSPMRAGLHLIKSFNLDHLDSAALFTTLHLGNATTCAALPLPPPSGSSVPEKGQREECGKGLLASAASFCAASNGKAGHILPKVAQCALVFAFDDALFLSCRQG